LSSEFLALCPEQRELFAALAEFIARHLKVFATCLEFRGHFPLQFGSAFAGSIQLLLQAPAMEAIGR
jgi:hypothetical protein